MQLLEANNISYLKRKMYNYGMTCCLSRQNPLMMHEDILKLKRAPEPNDVIWQNQGASNCKKICARLWSFTTVMILLGFCLVIIYLLNLWQYKVS